MKYYVGEKVRERGDEYTERSIFLPDINMETRTLKHRALIQLNIFKRYLDDWVMVANHLVIKEYRGQGHGRLSMKYAMTTIKNDYPNKDVFLVLYPDTDMLSFYESFGFQVVPGFYLHGIFPFMVYGNPTPESVDKLKTYGIQAADAILKIPRIEWP